MNTEGRPPTAIIPRPLCVQCRKCTRKAVFGSTSTEARLADDDVLRRFVCSNCGSRAARLFRAADDRDSQRWMADR